MTPSDPRRGRRKAVRRHRRERQILVFGLLIIALGGIGFYAAGVYRGEVPGPFNAEFVTPDAEYTTNVTLVCPPPGSYPLEPSQVAVRVLNATDRTGLASSTAEDLEGRGFVKLSPGNYARDYEGTARIFFGPTGVHKAYTVALQFEDAELVLDARTNATVDVVLGEEFVGLRLQIAPELDPETPLAANAVCLPAAQVDPQPAPRIYPEDPLASPEPESSEEPEPEPEPESEVSQDE